MATGIFEGAEENPLYQSPARARARSVFGVPMPKFLAGIASGIGSYDPQGGFFGNFARGLSGALQGGMGFDALAQKRMMEDQELQRQVERDELDRRYKESLIAENEAQAERAGVFGSGSRSADEALVGMGPEDFAALLSRKGELAKAARTPPRERVAPFRAGAQAPKANAKLERELFALDRADDPNELIEVSNDPKLEPETRQRAWAKMLRLLSATTPSQVR